jgi:hypothetical protein
MKIIQQLPVQVIFSIVIVSSEIPHQTAVLLEKMAFQALKSL